VGKGEIVGVFGLVGSGVEHLGRVIFGADGRRYAGTMIFNGSPYVASNPQHGKATGIGFVTAERKKDGILADLSVRENLVAPFQRRHGNGLFASRSKETEQARFWIRSLGIKTTGPEQEMRTLSGGNQQKVCVARWLDPSVRMLILEEPTRGVDVGARRELYGELTALAKKGLAILILSSDVEEIAGLCDRSMVIDRGTIVAEFTGGTEAARLMEATAGHTAAADENGMRA
jgi:ribose transport system ATP-binding protein